MITPFNVPVWSQRDPRWRNQRLGTVDGTTIGGQGCLITSIAMMNGGFDPGNAMGPDGIDNLFTANAGYANGNLVVWNAINRLLPNCASTGQVFCMNSPAPVGDIRDHLNADQLAILQVGFGGDPAQMHYVLAIGHNGEDIMFNDPWYGDQSSFATSRRYGTGDSSKDILAIHYFGDAISNTLVKPESPVATRPVEAPPLPTPDPPVAEPLPTPTPETSVGSNEVIEPQPVDAPIPEWVATWRLQPEKERSVVNPIGAKVVDMGTTQVIATLPVGYAIKDIAGFFIFQSTEWARTKWAVENNKWTAVRATDLSSPTLEIPVVKKDLDNIFTDISPQALESSFEDLATEIKKNSSSLAALRIHLSAVFAILLSPVLRKLGRKQ